MVASEVKSLAQQTAKAAGEIGTLIHDIQHAVDETVSAIAAVSSSVTTMSEANRQLTGILDHQAVDIDNIGTRAETVAGRWPACCRRSRRSVTEVEESGRTVLGTAEDLVGRSEWLSGAIASYFTDLEHGSIKIGVLHSLSGTMTASERPLQELLVMLIEQKNRDGGLLGRPIEPIIMNPRSDARVYAEQAQTLLAEHKVAAIFGCWTSASRKEVLPVVERGNGLLFYPSQYEGEESSPNIYYTGATPHQQGLPAINYLRGRAAAVLPGRHRLRLSAHHQRGAERLPRRQRHQRRRRRRTLHRLRRRPTGTTWSPRSAASRAAAAPPSSRP